MSRDDGFDRMDVATSIADDRKFRLLAKRHPELYPAAFTVYVGGLLAVSWRDGERLTLEEAWPALLPEDPAIGPALLEAGLVDEEMRIPWHAWEGWFGAASERRQGGRDRQRRYNAKRRSPADRQTDRQSGRQSRRNDDVTTTSLLRGKDTGTNGKSPDPWQGFDPRWDGLRAALIPRGWKLPPTGTVDDAKSQRGMWFRWLDSHPNTVLEIVADAPAEATSRDWSFYQLTAYVRAALNSGQAVA